MERKAAIKQFFDSIAKAYIEDLRSKRLTASGQSEHFREDVKDAGGTLYGSKYFYLLWNKKNRQGRKPGKMPPVEAIIQWLKDKKTFQIDVDRTKGLRSLAFAIALKIKKKGTDIYLNKRPALNVDEKIQSLKEDLIKNLLEAAKQPIVDEVNKMQKVTS